MATVFKRGGKKIRGGTYYIQWRDHTGKRRTKCAKTTDKAAALRIGAKLDADAALRRDGVIDPTLDSISRESQRTIESHLEDYSSKLQAAARDTKHVGSSVSYIRKICQAVGWVTVADITADGVNRYAITLRGMKKSARTIQAHLIAIKGFTRWLALHNKLRLDPLASVKSPNPNTDRRRERRMLTTDEWRWLESVTLNNVTRNGMSGLERALLYSTAIQTGLRSNELRSLTRRHLYLGSKPPYVTCAAGNTKNGDLARQYVTPELASELLTLVATKTPQAPVFKLPPSKRVAAMLRADLADARKIWLSKSTDAEDRSRREQVEFLTEKSSEGAVIDFHSLRHTCGAWLAMAGVHPKLIQAVMRHSTITLTMDTYGHLVPGQEADAVNRIRGLIHGPLEALKATGTIGGAQQLAQHVGRDWLRSGARPCKEGDDESNSGHGSDDEPKSLQIAAVGEVVRRDAKENNSGGHGTRTRNRQSRHLISNQDRDSSNGQSREDLRDDANRSAADGAALSPLDPSLQTIVDRWHDLPEGVRNAVVALVNAVAVDTDTTRKVRE